MSNIKVGDWVYYKNPCIPQKEYVFKVDHINEVGIVYDGKNSICFLKQFCHLLTPLKPGEAVERGTRCAVIKLYNSLRVGTIIEWNDFPDNPAPFANDENNHCFVIRRDKLARLPDCAQRATGVTVQEVMSNFKVGDWVYWNDGEGREAVFRVSYDNGLYLYKKGRCCYQKDACHLLTPLEPGEAKVGDRYAVIENNTQSVPTGEICVCTGFCDGFLGLGTSKGKKFLLYQRLARLPDCAQRATSVTVQDDPNTDADKPQKTDTDTEKSNDYNDKTPTLKDPLPCPHPEWEGVWLYCGEAHRIEWNGTGFMAHEINTPDMDVFCLCPDTEWYSDGPTPRWTQLEPAPAASTAGPKLPRPNKHGGVTVPWDPYGEG